MFNQVRELNLNNFEIAKRTDVWLEVIRDSLHRPVSVPIVVIKGRHSGPVFGITAAMHGDEVNGIGVIHKFLDRINPKNVHGTIVCVLVSNIPGYLKKTRTFSDRRDLNHIMPGKKNGNTAEVYAYNYFNKIIKNFDYLIDLHTASKGRQNTLYIRADLEDKKVAKISRVLNPEIILHNPPNDKTLRGAASKYGIPAATVEVGNPSRFQEKYIRRTVVGIKSLLVNAGILKSNLPSVEPRKTIKCKSSKWIYTDTGGVLEVTVDLGALIKKGEIIAKIKDIFGEDLKIYKSPSDGIVIGKSIDPLAETGSRLIHLGLVK